MVVGQPKPSEREIMRVVKVAFSNSDTIITKINGTEEEIRSYYQIGKIFNIGSREDNLCKVVDVEFL